MTPYFSIIIPARNEEAYLPRCLEAIQTAAKLTSKSLEIIVIINRCTDNTEQIALKAGCRVVYNNSKNLAQIRNTGAKTAQGKVLVTIDADSLMSANMLQIIEDKLSSNKIIGGGVLIWPSRWSLGIFLSICCLIPIALRYGISGGLFFCLKEDFDAIGGFDESLSSVEDIDFAKRLKEHGKKKGKSFITLFRAYIITSCRKFDQLGDWYFLRHPLVTLRLLKGRSQDLANSIWYDIER